MAQSSIARHITHHRMSACRPRHSFRRGQRPTGQDADGRTERGADGRPGQSRYSKTVTTFLTPSVVRAIWTASCASMRFTKPSRKAV